MDHPQASVVLPVRNGERFIADAIASVLQQSFMDWELIILDDGSTDATRKVIERFRDDRIVVLHHANRGLPATLNRGLSVARGEYIVRLDADDTATTDRLERQLAYLERSPGCVLVGGSMRVVSEDKKFIYTQTVPVERREIETTLEAGRSPFMHPSVVFRRDAAVEAGSYSEALSGCGGEDTEFFRRLSTAGRLTNLPEVVGDYRICRGAITTTIAAMPKRIVRRRSVAIERLARGCATAADYGFLTTFLASAQEIPVEYAYLLRIGKAYLFQAHDARAARHYFRAALRERPLSMKPWANLARSFWPQTKAPSREGS